MKGKNNLQNIKWNEEKNKKGKNACTGERLLKFVKKCFQKKKLPGMKHGQYRPLQYINQMKISHVLKKIKLERSTVYVPKFYNN